MRGTITTHRRSESEPAEGVIVLIYPVDSPNNRVQVKTDAQGQFFYNAPQIPSNYHVAVEHAQGYLAHWDETDISIHMYPPVRNSNQVEAEDEALTAVDLKPAAWKDRYFCGTNARVVLGESAFEVMLIQWSQSENKAPLFDHTQYHFHNVMGANRIVQGGLQVDLQNAFHIPFKQYSRSAGTSLTIYLEVDGRKTKYTLRNVHFTAMSQIVNPDGQVVGESYEFIARSIYA